MLDCLITNTTVVTVNSGREMLRNGAVAVSGDLIVEVGASADLENKYPDVIKKIDGSGKAVFPGLVNTHNHFFQTLLKGLGDDKVLRDWLADMTYPSSAFLLEDSCYYGAMLACLDGYHSGTTTMVEFDYAHPVPGLEDATVRCLKDLKVRAIFGRGYVDTGADEGVSKDVMQDVGTIEKEVRRVMELYHNTDNGRLKVWLAPAAVWSNSRESLMMTKRLADEYDTGVMLHISETPFDREAAQRLHGLPDIDVCEKLGLLGPKFLMAHCVHLTPRDIRMAKAYDAKVSHNPASNMYLSSGTPPIPALMQAGVTCGLATDGAGSNNSNDMLEALKLAALMQKVAHRDPTIITAEKVLEMATIDGARAIGMEERIGSLQAGKKADLFVFNPFLSPKAVPMHHPVSTLVYSSSQANVEMVMVDGRIVLEDGQVTVVNETEMLKKANQAADELGLRAGTTHLKDRPWRTLAF